MPYSKDELTQELVDVYNVDILDAEHAVEKFYHDPMINRLASDFDTIEGTAQFVHSEPRLWAE